jgi:hypothetical protein
MIPNPHGKFKLKRRRDIIFEGDDDFTNETSHIKKEGISDGILAVFVLC